MSRAKISFLGLYNYDDKLFDNFAVPDGVDRQKIINSLLIESAELEVIYSDWNIMEYALRIWSSTELDVWQRLYETTKYEYDPISNYDRNETWTDNTESGSTITSTSDNNTTAADTGKTTVTDDSTSTGTASSTVSNVAYNTYNFKDTNKTTGTNSGTNKGTTTTDVNNTTTTAGTDSSKSTSNGKGSGSHTGRMWGNIGVTTTQQMIREQRDIVKFCIEDYIKEQIMLHFCLLVY